MISYRESSILRDVAEMERTLVALKSPQRYGMSQVKGFKSNTVRVVSRILESVSGYELRGIRGYFSFRNDKPGKQVIPTLCFQLYNSRGVAIKYQTPEMATEEVTMMSIQVLPGKEGEESLLLAEFEVAGSSGSTDAFSADFWVLSNDSGVLTYEGDLDGTY